MSTRTEHTHQVTQIEVVLEASYTNFTHAFESLLGRMPVEALSGLPSLSAQAARAVGLICRAARFHAVSEARPRRHRHGVGWPALQGDHVRLRQRAHRGRDDETRGSGRSLRPAALVRRGDRRGSCARHVRLALVPHGRLWIRGRERRRAWTRRKGDANPRRILESRRSRTPRMNSDDTQRLG